MMNKNDIKFVRAFLIQHKMTQKEFAKLAGICEKTLYTALNTGKVSDVTYNKILQAMMEESMQNKLISCNYEKASKFEKFIRYLALIAIAGGLFCIFRMIF